MNQPRIPPRADHNSQRPKWLRIVRCTAGALAAATLLALVFRLLWNWAGVSLFTFPPLTYVQAASAMVFAGILFCIGMRMAGHRHGPGHASYSCRFSGCGSAEDGGA